MKILLGQQDVDPEGRGDFDDTPLIATASSGHEAIVEILLGLEEVNPDKQGDYCRTPLSSAAENAHEGVVKIILGRVEVDPNRLRFLEPNTALVGR